MNIASLGYVGFTVSDPAAWTAYASSVLGLMPVKSPSGATRFRNDAHAWRISLEEGPEDDLSVLGFEAASLDALMSVRAQLVKAGFAVADGDPSQLKERGVLGLLSTRDPSGLVVEVYCGPTEVHETPFISPAGVGAFVTGDQGLGHVVLAHPDIAAMRAFYVEALGFRLSDIIQMQLGPDFALDLEFYHCNPRHHTLALVPAPSPKRLHHFMLQAATLDDVGFALDRAGSSLTQTLGRHTNDHMVSFYAATPAGFQVEFGWGAREVDEAWRVVRYNKTSTWGHEMIGREG